MTQQFLNSVNEIGLSSNNFEFGEFFQTISRGNKRGKVYGAELTPDEPQTVAKLTLIDDLMSYILEGRKREGIFRMPGDALLIERFVSLVEKGKKYNMKKDVGAIDTAASLLKLYFRELPTPLIPKKHITKEMREELKKDRQFCAETREKFKETLLDFPTTHTYMLFKLCDFLVKFSEHSRITRMTLENLSMVFNPNVVKDDDDLSKRENNPMIYMLEVQWSQYCLMDVLKHYKFYEDHEQFWEFRQEVEEEKKKMKEKPMVPMKKPKRSFFKLKKKVSLPEKGPKRKPKTTSVPKKEAEKPLTVKVKGERRVTLINHTSLEMTKKAKQKKLQVNPLDFVYEEDTLLEEKTVEHEEEEDIETLEKELERLAEERRKMEAELKSMDDVSVEETMVEEFSVENEEGAFHKKKDIPKGVSEDEYNSFVSSTWSYVLNDEMFGPVDWEDFKLLFKRGIVKGQTSCLGGDFTDFVKIQQKNKLLKCLRY